MNRAAVALGVSSVVSLALGVVAGYFFAKKRLEAGYEELVKKEIAEAKNFYSALHKKGDFETPAGAVNRLIPVDSQAAAVQALQRYQGASKILTEPKPEVKTLVNNIFQSPDKEPDIQAEIQNRTEEAPYIISKEEFMANDPEYEQDTLTYYEGDQVLADQSDDPVEDIDMTVGDDNIVRFGHRSDDPNVVYVRNDSLERDFEILRSNTKYAEQVAGLGSADG